MCSLLVEDHKASTTRVPANSVTMETITLEQAR